MTDRANDIEAAINRGMQTQLRGLREAMARGVPRIGWKLGITDKASQAKWSLSEPLMACLDGEHTLTSGESLSIIPTATARAEAEIAIRINLDLGKDCALDEASDAIESLGPAIEIIDFNKPAGDLETILGHNIFHEGVVFASEQSPSILEQVDAAYPKVYKNGELVREPEPTLVPNDLAGLVQMVAKRLAQNSETLKAGDRIISGSFVKPLEITKGDEIRVDFGLLGKVTVSVA